jgi:hypothetical protein
VHDERAVGQGSTPRQALRAGCGHEVLRELGSGVPVATWRRGDGSGRAARRAGAAGEERDEDVVHALTVSAEHRWRQRPVFL